MLSHIPITVICVQLLRPLASTRALAQAHLTIACIHLVIRCNAKSYNVLLKTSLLMFVPV